MGIQMEFYECIEEQNKLEDIWEILCECDKEFIPALSSRESSYQSNLQVEDNLDVLPHLYYEEIIKQHFILAVDDEKVIGFMTFKSNYRCQELKDFTPSNYITTICVKKEYRNKGITGVFYKIIQSAQMPTEVRMPYISTRTWSLNHAHIHILESIGFEESERLMNHRGDGVDTIYFAKEIVNN
jgi:ribosomal protein S18 acetylase RimI-like enzyme